jgi:septal ring factor EnvC (AmiA/AmiB activator)
VALALELEDERDFLLEALPGTARRRRPWVPITLAALVLAAVLVFIAGNERQANTQFDQARDRIAAAEAELTEVRNNLRFLRVQISVSERALSDDTTLLQGVRAALAQAQTDASNKSSYIVSLKTCQGGVQQAVNALSVGDESHAVAALTAVSTACQSAATSSA